MDKLSLQDNPESNKRKSSGALPEHYYPLHLNFPVDESDPDDPKLIHRPTPWDILPSFPAFKKRKINSLNPMAAKSCFFRITPECKERCEAGEDLTVGNSFRCQECNGTIICLECKAFFIEDAYYIWIRDQVETFDYAQTVSVGKEHSQYWLVDYYKRMARVHEEAVGTKMEEDGDEEESEQRAAEHETFREFDKYTKESMLVGKGDDDDYDEEDDDDTSLQYPPRGAGKTPEEWLIVLKALEELLVNKSMTAGCYHCLNSKLNKL